MEHSMSGSWKKLTLYFSKDDNVTCDSSTSHLESFKTSSPESWSGALHTMAQMLRAPSSYFFGQFLRRDNFYPGTFDERKLGSVWWYTIAAKNWILGLSGTIAFSPAYALGTILRYSNQQIESKPVTIVITPSKSSLPSHITIVTRNTALLPNSLNGRLNMRDNLERAHELAQSFLKPKDIKDVPTILCLQEVFDEHSSQSLVNQLKSDYPYIIHRIAPSAQALPSGLFIASKHPILQAQFIQFPKTIFFRNSQAPLGYRINSDAFCNKGVLLSLIKHDQKYYVVVNSHCQPTISKDPREIIDFQKVRDFQLRIITQAAFDFVDAIQCQGLSIEKIMMTGDFNCSNHFGPGMDLKDREKNDYFFDGIFPGEALDTWLKTYDPRFKHAYDCWDPKEEHKDSTATTSGIQLDHLGILHLTQNLSAKKEPVSVYCDQGYSKNMPSCSSDHAGLIKKL